MARINVYLPDDLHHAWLDNRADAPLSAICQRALREVLSGERETPVPGEEEGALSEKLVDEAIRLIDEQPYGHLTHPVVLGILLSIQIVLKEAT